ncbi:MAG: sodium/solute symporter [Phycisphaerae bacterium]|nr:sodium/solute symporter [Phycisphaerae bacterium]
MPPSPGQDKQVGLAGPFAGVHNDALIVAGGANFPDKLPWQNGKKVWWDDAFVLLKGTDGEYEWLDKRLKLPRPLAYGVSISTDDGVICIGGCDGERCYSDVFLLKWDPKTKRIVTRALPPLPKPLAFMAGAKVGSTIYIAGGQESMKESAATKTFLALDLSKEDDAKEFQWRKLWPWPGPERILSVAAGQNDGAADSFFLFSGRNVQPGREPQFLTDAYRYRPKDKSWTRLTDILGKKKDGTDGRCAMAASGIASGAAHVLIFGGDDAADWGAGAMHPGFPRDILAYHTITDTWVKAGRMPGRSPVTTTAVRWDDGIVIPSGEIRPGIRTPRVWQGEREEVRGFGALNYSILAAYLAVLVCMGVYFARREKTTDDFFRAGKRIPWWAAGLSIFGTQLSALTFMAIPAMSFSTDWRRFMGNMMIVVAAPFIILFFLPFYRRLDVTTAYEYLEKRFNVVARLLGSVMFIVLQFGRIGIVLLLPSLALSTVTGIDLYACIAVLGVLCVVYTVLGGIEAVIWTDVIQVIVLMGGAILCLVLIPLRIAGGLGAITDVIAEADKMRVLDFRLDLSAPTFWVLVLGGFFAQFISYGTDQAVIQRYLTTRDEKSAARGIWTNALLCIPASLIFFGIGTALFVFYTAYPQQLDPTMAKGDAIFPLFIVTQLPPGVSGLLVAALFAAAMSSLDSSMNSVATAVTTDFYGRFNPEAPDRRRLALARWVTVIVGAAGTIFALVMAGWEIRHLWEQFVRYLGLFGGGLAGLFFLAIFTRRASGTGAVIGVVAAAVGQFAVERLTTIHPWFYPVTGIVVCFVAGYIASLLIPGPRKKLAGLTIYTLAAERKARREKR